MSLVLLFLAGALLCNALPHLAMGLSGLPFPTPFAKPRGRGDSSPLVNFYWGLFNLLLGTAIVTTHPVAPALNLPFGVLVAGALAIGTHLALHFGAVQRARRA
ncbi:hypothetical protein HNQ50_001876 [Silvimonas terrae]|uniref:Uncharacterized protein n=1 Tax=Silvimonas terrae TaxID=300266 RepID=A0A840RFR1_9NEIS|nr:hypothetical protein [Silvimonas terrae]MBB5191153.1 hypothetical protein [Silvimonas terrae]